MCVRAIRGVISVVVHLLWVCVCVGISCVWVICAFGVRAVGVCLVCFVCEGDWCVHVCMFLWCVNF